MSTACRFISLNTFKLNAMIYLNKSKQYSGSLQRQLMIDIKQGTFTYTLEVNNQQVDSKKMILAKD